MVTIKRVKIGQFLIEEIEDFNGDRVMTAKRIVATPTIDQLIKIID